MIYSSECNLAKHSILILGTALEAAAAIRNRTITSVELTEHVLRRIDRFQSQLNAYVFQTREEALVSARRADAALAGGAGAGVFHGVPFNVKESFGVQGQPCTWGIPAFREAKAARHSAAVERLLDAGGVLMGGTNVPQFGQHSAAESRAR